VRGSARQPFRIPYGFNRSAIAINPSFPVSEIRQIHNVSFLHDTM
jgi:hypothetical protein